MREIWHKEGFWLFGALSIALVAYVLGSAKIVDHDAFVMGDVAQRVAGGAALYSEAWDNKPPLALMFYFPSQWLAPGNYLVQQLFTFLWTAGQALLVFFLLAGEKKWIRLTAAIITLWMPLTRGDFIWGGSEDVVNGFAIVLALAGYRICRDGNISPAMWLACGMAAIWAFHARQTGILFLGLPVLMLLCSPEFQREKWRSASALALGSGIAFLTMIALMLVVSDWQSYLDALFNRALKYGGVTVSIPTAENAFTVAAGSPDAGGGFLGSFIQRVLSQTHVIRNVLVFHFSALGADLLLFIPLLAIFFGRNWQWRLFVAALLMVSLMAVLLPMKQFSHYHQQLIPAFVIGTVVILRRLQDDFPAAVRWLAIPLVLVIFLKISVTATALADDDGNLAGMNTIVQRIESESAKDATLFAAGKNSAYIYYRSKLRPVHKIHWEHFFGWLAIYLPVHVDTVMGEIIAEPPDWIILDDSIYHNFWQTSDEKLLRENRLVRLLAMLEGEHQYQLIKETTTWRVFSLIAPAKRNLFNSQPVDKH